MSAAGPSGPRTPLEIMAEIHTLKDDEESVKRLDELWLEYAASTEEDEDE